MTTVDQREHVITIPLIFARTIRMDGIIRAGAAMTMVMSAGMFVIITRHARTADPAQDVLPAKHILPATRVT